MTATGVPWARWNTRIVKIVETALTYVWTLPAAAGGAAGHTGTALLYALEIKSYRYNVLRSLCVGDTVRLRLLETPQLVG